jgi:hypothetical protein
MHIIGDLDDIVSLTDFQRMNGLEGGHLSFDAFYWMWVIELILEAADADLPTTYHSRIDGLLLVDNEELF